MLLTILFGYNKRLILIHLDYFLSALILAYIYWKVVPKTSTLSVPMMSEVVLPFSPVFSIQAFNDTYYFLLLIILHNI